MKQIYFVAVLLLSCVRADTYFVDNEGIDNTACGQLSNPCLTISYALAKCNTTTIEKTCTVSIARGRYSGDPNTNFFLPPYSNLVGQGEEFTIIDYENSTTNMYGINIPSAEQVTISGIWFVNFGNRDDFSTSLLQVFESSPKSQVTVIRCHFKSGKFTNEGEWFSIFNIRENEYLRLNISDSIFEENYSVCIKGTGFLHIQNSKFINNHKILFDVFRTTLNIINSEIRNNTENSALIILDGLSELTIAKSTITGNSIQSLIFIGLVPNPLLRSSFWILDSVFEENQGIYIVNGNSAAGFVANCTFLKNAISTLYTINSNVEISHSTFQNNHGQYPQIINYVDNDGISSLPNFFLYVRNCEFLNNFSESAGGAVRVSADANTNLTAIIEGTTFLNNSCAQQGGAIFANGNTFLMLNQTYFEDNTSTIGGDCIFCASTNHQAIILFSQTTFNNGNSDDFDIIYTDPNNPCQIACDASNEALCGSYGTLPSLRRTLAFIILMVLAGTTMIFALHIFCWKAIKVSMKRFGYTPL